MQLQEVGVGIGSRQSNLETVKVGFGYYPESIKRRVL